MGEKCFRRFSSVVFIPMEKPILIFDFDGVIVDSFQTAFGIHKLSKPTLTPERYRALWNKNLSEVQYEDPVEQEINFEEEYAKQFKSLGIEEEIKNSILKFSEKFRLFIISSTMSETIKEYLKHHGLSECFEEVLGYDIEPSKIKKFNSIFEKYSINPAEAIFVTDTSGDIKEARQANIGTIIGILGGFQDEEHLTEANPHFIVKNFAELKDLILNK
jgi:phosphoglycolate phosphatase-like HAD superfamily hydrolase